MQEKDWYNAVVPRYSSKSLYQVFSFYEKKLTDFFFSGRWIKNPQILTRCRKRIGTTQWYPVIRVNPFTKSFLFMRKNWPTSFFPGGELRILKSLHNAVKGLVLLCQSIPNSDLILLTKIIWTVEVAERKVNIGNSVYNFGSSPIFQIKITRKTLIVCKFWGS